MTPEERAAACLDGLYSDGAVLRANVASAIRAAVAEARRECAAVCKSIADGGPERMKAGAAACAQRLEERWEP